MGRGGAPIAIRRATAADRDFVVEMRIALMVEATSERRAAGLPVHDLDLDELRPANERWFDDHMDRDFVAWVAESGGRLVASIGLLWFAHPPGPTNHRGTEAYLLNVYTLPEARRRGIARELVGAAIAEARAAGITRVWLRTSEAGRPLYESMGFRSQGDELRLSLS